MNKIHRKEKKLNTKMSYSMFFLHSLNYIHIFILLILFTFLSLSFRGKLLVWKDICTHNHIQSLTHSFIRSIARSLTHSLATHHCLNMVLCRSCCYLVFYICRRKRSSFEMNVHNTAKRTNERQGEQKKKEIQLQMHPRAVLIWIEHSPRFVPLKMMIKMSECLNNNN